MAYAWWQGRLCLPVGSGKSRYIDRGYSGMTRDAIFDYVEAWVRLIFYLFTGVFHLIPLKILSKKISTILFFCVKMNQRQQEQRRWIWTCQRKVDGILTENCELWYLKNSLDKIYTDNNTKEVSFRQWSC